MLINVVLLVALIIVGSICFRAIDRQRKAMADLTLISRAARYHQEIEVVNASLRTSVYAALASGATHTTPDSVESSLEDDLKEGQSDLRGLERFALPQDLAEGFSVVRDNVERYQARARETVHGLASGQGTPAAMLPAFNAAYDAVQQAMERQTMILARRIVAANEAADQASVDAKWWLISASAVTSVLVCALVALLTASIRRSLRRVRDVAQGFAAGDFRVRAPSGAHDEVGELADAINHLADNLTAMMERLRSEADRDGFSKQVGEAMEMADSDRAVYEVVSRVMESVAPDRPMELLLADSSRVHLERAAQHPKAGAPGCKVESPFHCVAVRRGNSVTFPDSDALNACPCLRGRPAGKVSAFCMPLSFMGRSLGVLHMTAPAEQPPSAQQVAGLTTLGLQAGSRIGTLRAFQRTQQQASSDSLTGFRNRRAAEEQVRGLRAREISYALVVCDLDRFKMLNDTHGHAAGDNALRLFADTVRSVLRSEDIAARWGGEEFTLVLPGADAAGAAETAERIRQSLAKRLLDARGPAFTSSYGVCDSSMGGGFEDLLRLADDALYRAKEAGRDRVCVANEGSLDRGVARRSPDQDATVDLPMMAVGE
ncbi:MAG TPA: diguanylate cyclase [Steroidobacteraceae bacterium]